MPADKEQIYILIAISNNILCEGLQRVITENGNNRAFLMCHGASPAVPDIILFDSHQDLQSLQLAYPEAKAVLLDTGIEDQERVCLLVLHKISGIISPDATLEMFHKAIRAVHQGEIWIDQRHLKSLLHRNGALTESGRIKSLSSQDKKIVQLIKSGLKNREIGEKLCLSEHTVKAHVSRIFKHLNVANRAQLASISDEYNEGLHQLL